MQTRINADRRVAEEDTQNSGCGYLWRKERGWRKAFPLTAVDLKPKSHPYSPAKMGLFRISRVGIWGLQTRASVQMARDRGRVYRWEGSWEGNSNKIANKEPLAFPLQLLGREERLLPGCGGESSPCWPPVSISLRFLFIHLLGHASLRCLILSIPVKIFSCVFVIKMQF